MTAGGLGLKKTQQSWKTYEGKFKAPSERERSKAKKREKKSFMIYQISTVDQLLDF
jgi:hypothetical protein